MEWNVLGNRSWDFEGAEKRVYRVQLWTEKIKSPLIKAITTFENQKIDYFKCAMMAEFYRIILLGLAKATTIDGLKAEQILESDIRKPGVNSHSAAWNSLAQLITRGESDRDNRYTVIQYCNVIQSESHVQVFLNREDFDAMVRTVKSEKLRVNADILNKNDPVKLRRDAREYLKNILDRLDKVREEEVTRAEEIMTLVRENFGTDEIDDEDIEDLMDRVIKFYDTAQEGKMPVKYDKDLFDEVKKYSKSTGAAVCDIVKAIKLKDPLECILAFSQDPIRKAERLEQLLKKVVADVAKIQAEVEVKKQKYGSAGNSNGNGGDFADETTILAECAAIISKMGGTVC